MELFLQCENLTNYKVQYQVLICPKILSNSPFNSGILNPSWSVGVSTLEKWLVEDFPDTAIYAHKSDYCPECFEFETLLASLAIKMKLHKVHILYKHGKLFLSY